MSKEKWYFMTQENQIKITFLSSYIKFHWSVARPIHDTSEPKTWTLALSRSLPILSQPLLWILERGG